MNRKTFILIRKNLQLIKDVLPAFNSQLTILFVLAVFEVLIVVSLPLVSANIINALTNKHWNEFKSGIVNLSLILLLQLIINFFNKFYTAYFNENLFFILRERLLDRVLDRKYIFFEKMFTGDLVSRIVNDCSIIKSFISDIFLQISIDFFSLIIVVAVLFRMQPFLAVLTLVFTPFSIILNKYTRPKIESLSKQIRISIADMMGFLHNWFTRTLYIKTYNIEDVVNKKFQIKSELYKKTSVKVNALVGVLGSINILFSSIPSMIIYTIGGYFVYKSKLNIGELFAFLTFTTYFNGPIQRLIGIYNVTIPQYIPTFERVEEIYFDSEYKLSDLSPIKFGATNEGKFKIEEFEYVRDSFTLISDTIEFNEGDLIAVRGKNGSGKSTFLKLLGGLLQSNGQAPISESQLGQEKFIGLNLKQIYYSPQDAVLFDGTLIENITLFNSSPDVFKVQTIVERLGISKWIEELESGLYFVIDVNTCSTVFSNGQIQIIELCRMLYSEKEIILLDEPGVWFDSEIKNNLLIALKLLSNQGKTLIVATHDSEISNMATKALYIDYDSNAANNKFQITNLSTINVEL